MTEYVTNGTFDSDIVGWTDNSTPPGAIAWDASYGGSMLLADKTARADQQLAATVAGVQYSVTFVIESSNGNGTVEIGTSSGDDSLLSIPYTIAGTYTDTFIATGATTWIGIEMPSDEDQVYIDDVSVVESMGGGYWQSEKGIARITAPTLKMGDVAYRELLRAKANAQNVDALLANIYNYIVDAHERVNDITVHDLSSINLIPDGDMEATGTTSWTAVNSAILSKETTSPYAGDQNLKVLYNSVNNPGASTTRLTPGRTYRVQAPARASGCSAKILLGTNEVFSTSSGSWAACDAVGVADGTDLVLSSDANAPGDYAEFDSVIVTRVMTDESDISLTNRVIRAVLDDNDLMYQGERYRLQRHGPRNAATQIQVANWTFEYLPFTQYLNYIPYWSIEDSTIETYPAKILSCGTPDWCYLPCSHFVGVTPAQAAYGTWEWWQYKTAGATWPIISFISSDAVQPADSAQNGYIIQIQSTEEILLRKNTGGAPYTTLFSTAAATMPNDTWVKFTITRSAANLFSVYMNDVLLTAATGSNPVTDSTHTTSNYMVLDLDAGDKVALERFDDDIKLFTYEPL